MPLPGRSTSWRSQEAAKSGETWPSRATRVFQTGSAPWSAIAERNRATMPSRSVSTSTSTSWKRDSVKASHIRLRSSNGSASRSPTR